MAYFGSNGRKQEIKTSKNLLKKIIDTFSYKANSERLSFKKKDLADASHHMGGMIYPKIVNKNLKIPLVSTLNDFFLTIKYNAIKTTAKDILYQTNGTESRLIKAPKIAVKPQIKTIKCSNK